MPFCCSIVSGWSVGSRLMVGRYPTGMVCTIVFRLSVVGSYGSALCNQPKYGGSLSRRSLCHSSHARRKFFSLKETQASQMNGPGPSTTGRRMRPRIKKCLPSTTHWSDVSSARVFRSVSGRECQSAGAAAPKHIGSSSWCCPQVAQTKPVIVTPNVELRGARLLARPA